MNHVGQFLCVVVSMTGSAYCLGLLIDCRRRMRSLKGAAKSSPAGARLRLVGIEADCLSQLLLALVFLGVALFVLVEFSFQVASSLMLDSWVDRQIQSEREIVSLPGCPSVFFWHSASEGRPVYGIECTRRPVSDDQLRRLLPKAPELYYLNLAFTEITDDSLRDIGRMRGLCDLNLAGTRLSDAGLQHLANLKNLKSLSLEDTKTTDKGLRYLAELKTLEELDLDGTAVTDSGVVWLCRLEKLQSLEVEHTAVTQGGVDRLKRLLPAAKIEYSHGDANQP